MERSYLIEVLQTLSPDELQDFARFLASPQLQSNRQFKEMQALLDAIRVRIEDATNSEFDKWQVYNLVFPDSGFVEGKLEKLMTELNKILRQYLLIQYYFRPENEVQTQMDLINILEIRGLESRKVQTMQKLARQQQSVLQRQSDYYLHQSRLERLVHDHQSKYNIAKDDLNIPNVVENLDIFHHLSRLEMLNRFLLQQRLAQLEVEEHIKLALTESVVPQRYLSLSTELRIRNMVFQLLCAELPKRTDFETLLDILRQSNAELTEESQKEIYTYLRNFCVMLINSGATDLLSVLHSIQKENLERGYLYHQGNLPPSAFLSVVVIAIRVKQYEWLEQFLASHQDKIIGDNETQDLFRLNQALYLFAIEQYDAAMDLLPEKMDHVDYHLMARCLEIKIYYETQSDLLQYKLDAFRMFLSRASKKFLSDNQRKRNANFVNLVYQIIQSPQGDKARAERLLQRVQKKRSVTERDWLLEKVAELGKTRNTSA